MKSLNIWIILCLSFIFSLEAKPFQDGDVVCFLGDSITANGRYQNYISNYYLTRFPDQTIDFQNAGRPGDTASGSRSRMQEDVIDKNPTAVAIMFGMNDVSRGSYVANPDESKLKRQRQALERYQKYMKEVVTRIRKEGNEPQLYFLTPSPFDQTVILDKENNQLGCNDGLGKCAEFVKGLALENKGKVVDFHQSMTQFNLDQQKKDPRWTIVGGDRIHPGVPGHLMMAWLFLKSQNVSSLVSNIAINSTNDQIILEDNAKVSSVKSENGVFSFDVKQKALPFPIHKSTKELLQLLPVVEDLNQEILSIKNLTKGNYEVKIDGVSVVKCNAEELEKGINLAMNKLTPQFQQAQKVAYHNDKYRDMVTKARSLLNTRRWMKSYYKVDVDDPKAVQAHVDHFKDKKSYSAIMARRYVKTWDSYGAYLEQVKEHRKNTLASRSPKTHHYSIVPLK